MKRKELAALLMVGVFISGIAAAAATEAGSSGDPFLSLDWLRNTFIPNAVESAGEIIDDRFDDLTDEILASGTVGTELRVKRGDTLQLETGSQFMLLAGNVSIAVQGTVIDMTTGKEIRDTCDATANFRYLVAENTKSSFTVSSDTAVIRIAGAYELAPSTATDYNTLADALKAMGLFRGTTTAYGSGYDLENKPTRLEGLIMFLRLMGEEDAALAFTNGQVVFADVPGWGTPYVAYAYEKGYTKGQGTNAQNQIVFGSYDHLASRDYMTFLLRALGYTEGSDFKWSEAVTDARNLGILNQHEELTFLNDPFLRSHVVYLSFFALSEKMAGGESTLLDRLVAMKAIDTSTAQSAMLGLDSQRLK